MHSPDQTSLVLVDFDDTLVDTAPRFHNARLELFRMLCELGFDEAEIQRIHYDEVDPLMRRQHGFGPHRMEHSFRATYEALCRWKQRDIDRQLALRASAVGRTVAGTPPLLEGAFESLARLAQSLPTALYTQAADAEYQMGCIRDSGLLDVIPIERVIIRGEKTTGQFRSVLRELGIVDASTVWMVGNSMRSDINPALEAGANAIFVDVTNPWEYDVVTPHSNDYVTVPTFKAAVDFLLNSQEQPCR